MSDIGLTRQYIVDATGRQVGVILPIEEYQALVRLQKRPVRRPRQGAKPALEPLYGALRHLGGVVASTAEIDAARRELWADWNESDAPDLKR
jgi:hypothetical protein